jgi:hypothetical protein
VKRLVVDRWLLAAILGGAKNLIRYGSSVAIASIAASSF